MRTKLFLAFLLVIFTALISNLIFERLIMSDFDEYVKGTKEDHLYWVLASVEGSYEDGKWNMNSLSEAIHWGMMLGFEIRIEDAEGNRLVDSGEVMSSLGHSMKHRMEAIGRIHSGEEEFEKYPLYFEGKEVGTLFVRPAGKEGAVRGNENVFKKRGANFLLISFFIAAAGAVAMAVFFSLYLSRPINLLKSAAERVARGDFRVRVQPLSRRRGKGKGLFSDEIVSLSESFNYMAEALEKEEALRKRLTSNIAHELRTPLAVMKAQVEGIMDGVIEDREKGTENIRNEIEKLTMLVEGIEDLAKAEASFFSQGEYRRISLKEFLTGIEGSMEPVFREKGLRLSLVDRGDLRVVTDPEKVERVLRNIVSNSLKYTDKGGAQIDYGSAEGSFFVEVKDTGSGIPDDEIPQIFKRFYRGREVSDNGAGIGLAIVKELVDVMGGRVEVRSRTGEGTVFRVWLPDKKEPTSN